MNPYDHFKGCDITIAREAVGARTDGVFSSYRCTFQALALQEQIMNISVFVPELNHTVTMYDICYQPLAPDNKNCTIER